MENVLQEKRNSYVVKLNAIYEDIDELVKAFQRDKIVERQSDIDKLSTIIQMFDDLIAKEKSLSNVVELKEDEAAFSESDEIFVRNTYDDEDDIENDAFVDSEDFDSDVTSDPVEDIDSVDSIDDDIVEDVEEMETDENAETIEEVSEQPAHTRFKQITIPKRR